MLASGIGLGGAAFKEATDHTIKSSKDIILFEGVELLTEMQYTPTPEENRNRWFKRLALTTWLLGIAGIVLVIVDRLVLPLGDVFMIAFDRLANR